MESCKSECIYYVRFLQPVSLSDSSLQYFKHFLNRKKAMLKIHSTVFKELI